MKAVYGLYRDPGAAERAVDTLRAAGVADRDITVISSEPFDEFEFSARDRPTWIGWIALGGGGVGLTFGAWLTLLTETSWPLPTGGMPIVTTWPNLIIMFELTMLAAVLATVVSMLVTTKLLRRLPALYDPAVTDGFILVGVEGRALGTDLRRVLETSGAASVRALD